LSLCKQFLVKSSTTKTKTANGQLAIWQQRTQLVEPINVEIEKVTFVSELRSVNKRV